MTVLGSMLAAKKLVALVAVVTVVGAASVTVGVLVATGNISLAASKPELGPNAVSAHDPVADITNTPLPTFGDPPTPTPVSPPAANATNTPSPTGSAAGGGAAGSTAGGGTGGGAAGGTGGTGTTGGGTTTSGGSTTTTSGSTGATPTPTPVPTPAKTYNLPASQHNEILYAVSTTQTRQNGEARVLARSFAGSVWEPMPDTAFVPAEVECDDDDGEKCNLKSTSAFTVQTNVVDGNVASVSTRAKAARLLSQGAFGGSITEIDALNTKYADNVGQWVEDQMQIPMTSTRQYKRERTNPRMATYPILIAQPETRACDLNTRWHEYVFETRDVGKTMTLSADPSGTKFMIKVAGSLRSTADTFAGEAYPGDNIPEYVANGRDMTLTVCKVYEGKGEGVQLLLPGAARKCNVRTDRIDITNPTMAMTAALASSTLGTAAQTLETKQATFVDVAGGHPGSKVLTARTGGCTLVPDANGNAFIQYGGSSSTQWLRFDKRLRYWTNTIEEPSKGGPGPDATQCPSVPRSYQNRGHCVRRPTCGQGVGSFGAAQFTLDEATLRAWYTDLTARRYVYRMAKLRLEPPYAESFCTSRWSRWWKLNAGKCAQPTVFSNAATGLTIQSALTASSDSNPYVRDIILTTGTCEDTDAGTIGAKVEADGSCWEHVHPDTYSVRDATNWVKIHDGNAAAGTPNPIAKWADDGGVELEYPASHPMMRWYDRQAKLPHVGRFGDQISFEDLNSNMQTTEMAIRVGALREADASANSVVCGSHGEVGNDPTKGHHYDATQGIDMQKSAPELEHRLNQRNQQAYPVNNVMFKAKDQLRQRVAWTLLNQLVIGSIEQDYVTESFLGYYDIFVRNAFGNFKDILRDVSWSTIMSIYLTYEDNRSYAASGSFPDENYAREIMQLYTIGLKKLKPDGTVMTDSSGEPLATYSNEDIMDYARIWTGLEANLDRLNTGDERNPWEVVDPLQARTANKDRFPKAKLDKGHIGDTYPLCDELPPQPWLKPGARYEFTGSKSVEGDEVDDATVFEDAGRRGRFQPAWDGSSALYNKLCAPVNVGGPCTFPLSVELDTKLPCNGQQECEAGRVLTAAIYDPAKNVTRHYQYLSPPCVRLALFEEGQTLQRTNRGDRPGRSQCSAPETVVGQPACCDPSNLNKATGNFGSECLFVNEVVSYDLARTRCEAQGKELCSFPRIDGLGWATQCSLGAYIWTRNTCKVQIQVYDSGRIGVTDPQDNGFFKQNSYNVFRARWEHNKIPLADAGGQCPADSGCTPITSGSATSCICDFTVKETVPYPNTASLETLTPDNIADVLFIGSGNPRDYNDGDYTECTSTICNSLAKDKVKVWLYITDTESQLSNRTIIEIPPVVLGGRTRYLRNRVSMIHIGAASTPQAYRFRNMPNFIPMLGFGKVSGTDRDKPDTIWKHVIEYEVEAFLEHLVEHPNTGVFLAIHFIKNMVTSNPSPRYIKAVNTAFTTGKVGDKTFSGKHGDMAALVYAVLTDVEARSPSLLADSHEGMVMDPLVKTMMVLRGLEYKSTHGREVILESMWLKVGVQVFDSPSVFNFYSPYYEPDGAVTESGLIAPQAELLTPPQMIAFLNGMFSLVDNGLTSCQNGFATGLGRKCNNPSETADGTLQYVAGSGATDARQVVDDLNLVLTGGRILADGPTYKVLVEGYEKELYESGGDATKARKFVTKLLLASPEFQTTSINKPTSKTRPPPTGTTSQNRRMKTIVMIDLKGGADSANFLMPKSGCAPNDLFQQYTDIRGLSALTQGDMLEIDATGQGQPCTKFGMHTSMTMLKNLYNDGDLVWFANAGGMVEPMTKKQYKDKTKQRPPLIYSHNGMQQHANTVEASKKTVKTGVLGRLANIMRKDATKYDTRMVSYNGAALAFRGAGPFDILKSSGSITALRDTDKVEPHLKNMTENIAHSPIVDFFMENLIHSIEETNVQKAALDSVTLEGPAFGISGLSKSLEAAAKNIKARAAQKAERLMLYTTKSGWDTHNTADLIAKIADVDTSIGKFVAEMKLQGRWDDTVIVVVSEFGRTFRNNGRGTDHGWGGNYFMLGGKINGGRVLGKFPTDLTEAGDVNLSQNGRMMPTTPFEGMWKGVLDWYGVSAAEMAEALPNLKNFTPDVIYDQNELFN